MKILNYFVSLVMLICFLTGQKLYAQSFEEPVMFLKTNNKSTLGYRAMSAPDAFTLIGNLNSTNFLRMDFDENNVLYAIDLQTRKLIIIDQNTATTTDIGVLTGIPTDENIISLSFNYKTNKFYVLTHIQVGINHKNNLYTLDKTSGLGTFHNVLTSPYSLSLGWMVIDNDGIAFASDITQNSLLKIDLSTGVVTPIGLHGVKLSYGADVNPNNNTIYAAGYNMNNPTGGGYIFKLNKLTGGTDSLVCTTGSDNYTGLAIGNSPTLAVSATSAKKNISIYPNPVSDILNINSKEKFSTVEIYSIDGKLLLSLKSTLNINVSNLRAGTYLLKLKNASESKSLKFIKK